MERVYGWKPQPQDDRDLHYSVAKPGIVFPEELVHSEWIPTAMDQGNKGSCTAHGIIGNYLYGEKKNNLPFWMPSRLGLYYDERESEGTVNEDAGAIIRDGIKVFNRIGVGPESIWPYDTRKFAEKPPPEYYAAANKNRIKFYASVNNSILENLKLPILHGNPVTFGFQVYQNFEDYKGGVLQHPTWPARSLGGHCVWYYGYSDKLRAFKCMNSWGTNWGIDGGSFWMSYDYITSVLCSDFWTIRLA